MARAESIQAPQTFTDGNGGVMPLLVPVFLWKVLVAQGALEGCSPGEVLDKAVCEYLEANGGERAQAVKSMIESGQSIAHSE